MSDFDFDEKDTNAPKMKGRSLRTRTLNSSSVADMPDFFASNDRIPDFSTIRHKENLKDYMEKQKRQLQPKKTVKKKAELPEFF